MKVTLPSVGSRGFVGGEIILMKDDIVSIERIVVAVAEKDLP